MELIDQLEQRIEELLQSLAATKEENRRLKEEAQRGRTLLEEENARLKQEIERERTNRNDVLQRVDSLLHKIKDATSES